MFFINQNNSQKYSLSLVNTLLGKKYSIDKKIGVGRYSSVYKGLNIEDKKQYAIKFYNFQAFNEEGEAKEVKCIIKRKIQIMQSIDHRNILKVYDVYENFRYLLYVTDLCATMNLKDEVQFHDYSEIESKNILKQIIMGVHQLLKQGIILKSISPSKILLKNGIYKINQFGLYDFLESYQVENSQKTRIWISPQNQNNWLSYKSSALPWTIGTLFYYILFKLQYEQNGKIFHSSKQVHNFLRKTLVQEEKRMKWKQILEYEYFLEDDPTLSKFFVLKYGFVNQKFDKDIDDLSYELQKQRKRVFENQIEIQTIKFSFDSLNRSDISIYNELKDEQQEKIFQIIKDCYFQARKTQYLMQKIIQPIEYHQLLDLSERDNVQFMYLISSRCFTNISLINQNIKTKDGENQIIANFIRQTKHLYNQCLKYFNKYVKKLTQTQNKFSSIVLDRLTWFNKSNQKKQKQIIMNGIQGMDFDKVKHTYFIKINYIEKCILRNLKKQEKINELIEVLQNYSQICLLEEQTCKDKTFQEIIEERIIVRNSKKTVFKNQNLG